MKKEIRNFNITELRVARNDGEPPVIEGYAAVFNSLSEDLGGFKEIIRQGAFADTITTADVRALWNHDPNYVLGRNKAGTLELAEDEKGLKIRIHPPMTQWAKDLMESMHRGDVDQMSFGFRTISDNWKTEDGIALRELLKVELFDVSPVTYPAYPATEVGVRSASEVYKSYKESLGNDPLNNPSDSQAILSVRKMQLDLMEKE